MKMIITIYAEIYIVLVLLSSEAIYEHVYSWWDNLLKILVILFSFPAIFLIRKKEFIKTVQYCCLPISLMIICLLGGMTGYKFFTITIRLIPIILFVKGINCKQVDVIVCLYNSIFFLICISLIFYILFDLNFLRVQPSMYSWMNESAEKYTYFNYYGIYFRWHNVRNVLGIDMISANGVWHEPGAYQIYGNLGFFIASFVKEKEPIIKKIIFILSVISSTSTMGLIILAFLIILNYSKNMKIWKFLSMMALVIVASFFIYYLIIQKSATMNWAVRINNVSSTFQAFLTSPIFGVKDYNNAIFSGFISYLINMGVFGIYPIYIFFKGALFNNVWGKSTINKIAVCIWYCLCMMNENYAFFNFMFVIYAISLICNKLTKKEGNKDEIKYYCSNF